MGFSDDMVSIEIDYYYELKEQIEVLKKTISILEETIDSEDDDDKKLKDLKDEIAACKDNLRNI